MQIPYGRQAISEEDIAAVVAVLRSDFLTQGEQVPAFEAAIASHCGVSHAVACNSATSALHIACLSLGLGPGDSLWTVPNTFVASANCARYCGAEVDFVDIDPVTRNLSVVTLQQKLIAARQQGTLPKVVVPVAFAGLPCDMAAIRALADDYGFAVIEDASHAIGASYQGQAVGAGSWADITIFSFHPVKIITTGEGGMAVTRHAHLAQRMAQLRSHGITRDPAQMESPSEGPWYYQMTELGWNYRMTDMQAALGRSQLHRLPAFVQQRMALADRYDHLLTGLPIGLPARQPGMSSAWHLYVIDWNEQATGRSRAQAFAALRTAGIGVNVHYIPVHLQPYYRRRGFGPGDFPHAERHYAQALSLPMYATLSETQQDFVVKTLADLCAA